MSRFLLLDFGYPMSPKTIKNVINSLENTLVFRLGLSPRTKETLFGIFILNSDFAIIRSESNPRKTYDTLAKILNEFLKKTSERITVQKFKNLLNNSIEAILCEIQKKFRTPENLDNQPREQFIQMAVVSRKTAWVLANILTTLTSKFQKDISVENIKIVQILNESQCSQTMVDLENNASIDCIFCKDDPRDLNIFFKNWLLNQQFQLRILVSNDANLEMKCEIEDCIVNPTAFCWKPDSDEEVQNTERSPLFGVLPQVCYLEIINRIPVSGLCPTLVFGTPRRVRATRWNESPTNSRMFKELCRELNRTGEGLLAKSVLPTEENNLVTFHFLTSDGDMILVNDVAPNELHLPKREQFSNSVESSDEFFEHDSSVIKECLQKINFLNEFKPENFSSGIGQYLRSYLGRTERTKSSSAKLDIKVSNIGRYIPTQKTATKSQNYNNDNKLVWDGRKRKLKAESERKIGNVHPALLSPKVVQKYRKISKQAFNFRELEKDFM